MGASGGKGLSYSKNTQKGPKEGKAGQQHEFVLRPTLKAPGRDLISLVAAALRNIGKRAIESQTKADENVLLPLAPKGAK